MSFEFWVGFFFLICYTGIIYHSDGTKSQKMIKIKLFLKTQTVFPSLSVIDCPGVCRALCPLRE